MKRWFVGVAVFLGIFVAGAAMAQMDPGPYHVLHKDGAIYNSDSGWILTAPPYYPGTTWVVDFLYNSQGLSILHRDGAIWNSNSGWILSAPPYYPGTGYAKALEYQRDVTGCWGFNDAGSRIEYVYPSGPYQATRQNNQFPNSYVDIQSQYGTRLAGEIVTYDDGCNHMPFEGTIIGDLITLVCPADSLTVTGLLFWNGGEGRWEIRGSVIANSLDTLPGGNGFFSNFHAWPETGCQCPPPIR